MIQSRAKEAIALAHKLKLTKRDLRALLKTNTGIEIPHKDLEDYFKGRRVMPGWILSALDYAACK